MRKEEEIRRMTHQAVDRFAECWKVLTLISSFFTIKNVNHTLDLLEALVKDDKLQFQRSFNSATTKWLAATCLATREKLRSTLTLTLSHHHLSD